MLRKRELHDAVALYNLMKSPKVFPYVREKANSLEEYQFITKQIIDLEEQGKLISRVIMDEFGTIVGTINLFDITNNAGFLGTWLGENYHGKGYNKKAKEDFFLEVFMDYDIDNIFMKVRKTNTRSKNALKKMPYIFQANTLLVGDYDLQYLLDEYDLYVVSKKLFFEEMHNKEELMLKA